MNRDILTAFILCNETKRMFQKERRFDLTVAGHEAIVKATIELTKGAKESFREAMLAGEERFIADLTACLTTP